MQTSLTPRGELISALPSPLEIMLSSERRRIVHESLDEALTEKERQVISLTYWDGIESIREIAAIMGVTLQAATAVLTPLLDATFEECSYGYRKGKGRRQALMEIMKLRDMGYIYVLDADIEKIFDNIDHFLLIQRLADLVPEESVVRLVASWLTVDIHDGNTVYQLTKGVPQGSSLSPLLSNLYLDLFDKVMMERGYKLIRYCDDFVVLAQHHAVALEAHDFLRYGSPRFQAWGGSSAQFFEGQSRKKLIFPLTQYRSLCYNYCMMKRININISEKQHKEFHRIAKEEGLTFSELIRRALDEYLRRQKRHVKS